jgi:hypothetical protein
VKARRTTKPAATQPSAAAADRPAVRRARPVADRHDGEDDEQHGQDRQPAPVGQDGRCRDRREPRHAPGRGPEAVQPQGEPQERRPPQHEHAVRVDDPADVARERVQRDERRGGEARQRAPEDLAREQPRAGDRPEEQHAGEQPHEGELVEEAAAERLGDPVGDRLVGVVQRRVLAERVGALARRCVGGGQALLVGLEALLLQLVERRLCLGVGDRPPEAEGPRAAACASE